MVKKPETRTYSRKDCITFRKTAEKFGGLSNMAPGYPLLVNGTGILTSEALYQACRFPHLPEVQKLIIAQRSPMTAKMKSKPYRDQSRSDWERVKVEIMRWSLRVKLAQNWEKFGNLLLSTGDKPIVEDSYKDNFWGAIPVDGETLVGVNALGRLLMELREKFKQQDADYLRVVKPLSIPDFLLYGEEIGTINMNVNKERETAKIELQIPEAVNYISEEKTEAIATQEATTANQISTDAEADKKQVEEKDDLVKDSEESAREPKEYDSFKIIWPHIEPLLTTERKHKELAEIFNVRPSQMSDWLKRGEELGKVKKLSKPVRYVATSTKDCEQLSLSLDRNAS